MTLANTSHNGRRGQVRARRGEIGSWATGRSWTLRYYLPLEGGDRYRVARRSRGGAGAAGGLRGLASLRITDARDGHGTMSTAGRTQSEPPSPAARGSAMSTVRGLSSS